MQSHLSGQLEQKIIFTGVIDLLARTAYQYDGKAEEDAKIIDIPADLVDLVEEKRTELIEAVAELMMN